MRVTIIALISLLGFGSLEAQCFPDRHNGTWFDAWTSCETAMNPNLPRGEGHWIHYDLGYDYILGELEIWNINDPAHLDRGAEQIAIDVSSDGLTWTEIGEYDLLPASGTSIYEGDNVMDFEGLSARYLLITVLSNHGDANCTGFSELRIAVEGAVTDVTESSTTSSCLELAIFPNPHRDRLEIRMDGHCGGNQVDLFLYDAMGRTVEARTGLTANVGQRIHMDNAHLPAGLYFLEFRQGASSARYQIVKVD